MFRAPLLLHGSCSLMYNIAFQQLHFQLNCLWCADYVFLLNYALHIFDY